MAGLSHFLTMNLLSPVISGLIITLGLLLGLDDYAANATGLLFSLIFYQRWNFDRTATTRANETVHFGLAVGLSYLANFAVLYIARSVGLFGNSLIHGAAIATYNVMFFLLTRHFSFTKARMDGGLPSFLEQSWPTWLLMACAIGAWLFLHHIELSHDLHWQFWIARQILGGSRLYVEIWELNPPLWFWSAIPLQWLAQFTGVAWQSLLIAEVLALGAASAWLVARLIEPHRATDRATLMLAQFWIITIIPLADIGQREHLALITSLPYAALIARRSEGASVSWPIVIIVGVLSGYGFALKHYFALIPLALEWWLFMKFRRDWRPVRTETVILAVLALSYAASIALIAPEFFTVMVPMVRIAYDSYNSSFLALITQPWPMFWLASIAFLYLVRPAAARIEAIMQRAFFQALMIVASAFALAYFVQKKGWYYHSLPANGALALGLALVLIPIRDVRDFRLWIGLMLLALPTSTLLTPRPASHPIARISEQLLGDVPAGKTVFVATTAPRLAWPIVEQRDLVWPSRAFVLWMLPAVAKAEVSGHTTPELKRLANKVLKANSFDIRCHPPERIIFQRMPLASQGDTAFLMRDFLLRDTPLRNFIEQHYILRPSPPTVEVFQRLHPVAGLSSTQCIKIY